MCNCQFHENKTLNLILLELNNYTITSGQLYREPYFAGVIVRLIVGVIVRPTITPAACRWAMGSLGPIRGVSAAPGRRLRAEHGPLEGTLCHQT